MEDNCEGFADIYKELGELIGIDKTLIIYENMKGQQVTFPKKLYSAEYVKQQLLTRYTGSNIKELARELNYTERYLRKLLNQTNISK